MCMKTCTQCKLEKSEEDFNWKNKAKLIRHSLCKLCSSLAQKNHYKRSPQGVLNRRESNQKSGALRRERNREFVWAYLLANPCIRCPEVDPILLEFDHRDPTQKAMAVSVMICGEYSIKRISEEIDKCDVLCVSCHRRKTATQLGWWKSRQ